MQRAKLLRVQTTLPLPGPNDPILGPPENIQLKTGLRVRKVQRTQLSTPIYEDILEEPKKKIKRVRIRDVVLGDRAGEDPRKTMMVKQPRKRRYIDPTGTVPFVPTDEQRAWVELAIANGTTHKQCARMICNPETGKPLSREVFKRVFQNELEVAHTKHRLVVARTAFDLAVGRPAEYDEEGNRVRKEIEPTLPAVKWYEQSRFGLKEGTQIVLTDNEGNALQPNGGPGTINIGQVVFMLPKNGYEGSQIVDITPQAPAQIEAPKKKVKA